MTIILLKEIFIAEYRWKRLTILSNGCYTVKRWVHSVTDGKVAWNKILRKHIEGVNNWLFAINSQVLLNSRRSITQRSKLMINGTKRTHPVMIIPHNFWFISYKEVLKNDYQTIFWLQMTNTLFYEWWADENEWKSYPYIVKPIWNLLTLVPEWFPFPWILKEVGCLSQNLNINNEKTMKRVIEVGIEKNRALTWLLHFQFDWFVNSSRDPWNRIFLSFKNGIL